MLARLAPIAALAMLVSPGVARADGGRIWLFDLTVTTEIGLYDDSAGDPISVAPDVSLLAKDLPQFEIIHSSAAITGFHGIPLGTSLCVAGDGCGDVYHNAGLQIGYTLRSHAAGDSPSDGLNHTAVSITGGLLASNFDPFDLSLKLGVRFSYLTDSLVQLQLVPNLHVALDDRDTRDDRLFVPVTIGMAASETFTLQLETGIATAFDDLGDNLQIPLGVNVDIIGNNKVVFLASFSFPAIYGGDAIGVTGLDARVATVGLRWSTFLGADAP